MEAVCDSIFMLTYNQEHFIAQTIVNDLLFENYISAATVVFRNKKKIFWR